MKETINYISGTNESFEQLAWDSLNNLPTNRKKAKSYA